VPDVIDSTIDPPIERGSLDPTWNDAERPVDGQWQRMPRQPETPDAVEQEGLPTGCPK